MNEIKVQNVSFAYTLNDVVLNNISVTIDTRSTAIVGQNGAGKTTFVKLLKGLLRPSNGNIYVNNKDISSQSVASIAKQVGLVFQNPDDQIFKRTVLEEIMFGPLNIGMTKVQAQTAAKEALLLVGLLGYEQENPYDLGLSERKMIAIASILAMNTPIIIFDEPTIAQDYSSKEKIKNIITYLKEQGKIVLTIIHDMDFVAECFERTIVFANGEIILDDDTNRVFAHEALLKEAFLELPHITSLSKQLGYQEVCLTDNEFIQLYKELY